MKSFKRYISLLLAVVMLSLTFVSSAAATQEYDHYPKIYVNGVGSRAVYMADDQEKKPVFFPVNGEAMMENLKNFGEYISDGVKNGEYNLAYSVAYNLMWETCGGSALDKDGITPLFNSTIDPCELDYGGEGVYNFNYDSRLDPVDLAHQLYDYIALVREDSGCEKYELVASSYGTAVLAACLKEHPDVLDYADSVVFCVPTIGGMEFVGELFSGNISTDSVLLEDYLSNMLGSEEMSLFLSILQQSGIFNLLVEYAAEPLAKAALLRAAKDIVRDIFATFPSMWSFVTDDYFYQTLEYLYGENYADPDHEYAGLISKVTYYHEEVMMKMDEVFSMLDEREIHTALLVKYDKPIIPLTAKSNVMSDGLVTLEGASFGGFSSRYGERLEEGYEQKLHTEYDMLSPDGCIDASTGAYPFTTWYIKNLDHGTRTDSYYKLMNTVAYENLDVYTDESYPQFLVIAEDGETIIPLEKTEPEQELSFLGKCGALIKLIFENIVNKIKGIFDGNE